MSIWQLQLRDGNDIQSRAYVVTCTKDAQVCRLERQEHWKGTPVLHDQNKRQGPEAL